MSGFITDWRSHGVNLALIVSATLLPLLAGELAARIYRGKVFSLADARFSSAELLAGARAVYDPSLGYLPRPGRRVADFTSTIGENGLRLHHSGSTPDGPLILATGDSYTFGDEVDDDETWPAHLQALTARPVLNGGVFGYGLDQTILRTESLLKEYRPQTLIISMIADDLKRSELSYRHAWKPYFDIVNGELTLRNVPVPQLPPPVRYRQLRDFLSHSHLADAVFRRLAPTWWYVEGSEQRIHQNGLEVAILLMQRVADLTRDLPIRVLVVAQCDRYLDTKSLQPVLRHAAEAGLETLDLTEPLADLIATNPDLEERFFIGPFAGHMTSEGNSWVAEKIANKLNLR